MQRQLELLDDRERVLERGVNIQRRRPAGQARVDVCGDCAVERINRGGGLIHDRGGKFVRDDLIAQRHRRLHDGLRRGQQPLVVVRLRHLEGLAQAWCVCADDPHRACQRLQRGTQMSAGGTLHRRSLADRICARPLIRDL
ncbi:MAG TPA: hypothetical protein VFA59_03540 [Vicinamibacterales bacterium]|nr:hypothetical protein [Vicinamibacterales bacterium]